jgi:uncharacterized protein YqgV (UPF0045/DUF77 family)
MDIGVDISMYPLDAQFIPPIKDFIQRLQASGRCKLVTNSLSTQLFGTYEEVFALLRDQLRISFEQQQENAGKAVFVLKLVGPMSPA